jgi:hypothetical protein
VTENGKCKVGSQLGMSHSTATMSGSRVTPGWRRDRHALYSENMVGQRIAALSAVVGKSANKAYTRAGRSCWWPRQVLPFQSTQGFRAGLRRSPEKWPEWRKIRRPVPACAGGRWDVVASGPSFGDMRGVILSVDNCGRNIGLERRAGSISTRHPYSCIVFRTPFLLSRADDIHLPDPHSNAMISCAYI